MTQMPVAIITGAGGGIGRVLARGLAIDGYLTVLVGRSRSSLEQTAREIVDQATVPAVSDPRIEILDLTDQKGAAQAVEKLVFELGRVDLLVNNAGQWIGGTLDASREDYRRLFELHVLAPLALTQAVIATMLAQGSGHILNIASRAGKVGFADSGAYCASKFAEVGLNESLYRELVPKGIKVTALCPGWVHTDMAMAAGLAHDPHRVIQPDDLLATVRWLLALSPGACVKEVLIESPISMV